MKALTDEAKDVSDGGDEDHQEVVEGQYDSGDEEVSDPAELFSSETQRDDWRTDLKTQINTQFTKRPLNHSHFLTKAHSSFNIVSEMGNTNTITVYI